MTRSIPVVLVAAFATMALATSAAASVNYHSSRSNRPPSVHFVHDPVPCGGGGECLGGGAFGSSCTTNADCATGMCAVRTPDTTTGGGMAACSGFQTFDELAGGLSNGWHFGPKSKAQLKIKEKKGLVFLQLKLKDIEDAAGLPSNESGQLALQLNMRWVDPVAGDMTLPASLSVSMDVPLNKGKGTYKYELKDVLITSYGFANIGTAEFVITDIRLIDPNGNRFGAVGFSTP